MWGIARICVTPCSFPPHESSNYRPRGNKSETLRIPPEIGWAGIPRMECLLGTNGGGGPSGTQRGSLRVRRTAMPPHQVSTWKLDRPAIVTFLLKTYTSLPLTPVFWSHLMDDLKVPPPHQASGHCNARGHQTSLPWVWMVLRLPRSWVVDVVLWFSKRFC